MFDKPLNTLLTPSVAALGYELVGVERLNRGRETLLRLYIDQETGICIEDCEKVSRHISAIMDVEDPIQGQYVLEVSSPGLDRPLFTREHFVRFTGSDIKLRLLTPRAGRRNFTGKLLGFAGDDLLLQADDNTYELPYGQIEKANLIPQF